MFRLFKKRRGEGPVDQRAPLQPLSAEVKAQRDREFAERLQQRLNTQMAGGFGDDGKIEPKFKTSAKPAPEPPRPTPAANRADLRSSNGTERPDRMPPHGMGTSAAAAAPAVERDAKRPTPILSLPLVMRAAQFAAERHRAQRRKGIAREPYVNHVLEVATLLAEATDGKDPELVVAALLHDLIDEHGISADELASLFGVGVAALVLEVTDDKAVPPAERRRLQIVSAPHKSPRARMLKIADIVSDLRALRQGPPTDWPLERQREYLQWARDVVGGCRGVNQRLDAAFDDAYSPLAPEPSRDLHLRASSL